MADSSSAAANVQHKPDTSILKGRKLLKIIGLYQKDSRADFNWLPLVPKMGELNHQ